MKLRKAFSIITAICLILSFCQFTFAATPTYEVRDDAVFIGFENNVAQYVEIGEDMNGLVGASSKDSNPVPDTAKYTNGLYVQGAQVRLNDVTPTALRFIVVNNTDMTTLLRAAGVSNIRYGAFVAFNTNETLTNENSTLVTAKNIFKTAEELNTDYQKFTVCVTNIPEGSVRLDISVRPFMRYTDPTGVSRILYGEQYKCDIYDAAVTAYKSGKESASMNQALYDQIVSKGVDKNGNIPAGNEFVLTDDVVTKWRNLTDNKISQIQNTPNMEIPAGATVYYVSPNGRDSNDGKSSSKAWQTLENVNNLSASSNTYVLFERGGTWRGQLNAKAGITYSAYGTGAKPVLIGSPSNATGSSNWTKVYGTTNVWKYRYTISSDVGAIIFNEGQYYGTKLIGLKQDSSGTMKEFKSGETFNGYSSLTKDLQFWHDSVYSTNKYLYVYSTSNPGTRFSSIEFAYQKHGITISGNNITIDNIAVKYVGAHGISAGSVTKNLTVTNCTFEFIGGSQQWVDKESYPHKAARYGNGVEIYGGCDGFTVSNCYFSNIYDAAVTHQIGMSSPDDCTDTGHYNVTFSDNVMEYCTYSIEYFWKFLPKTLENGDETYNKPADNPSYLGNILYENNLMWYCGEGLGSQRPDNTQPAHIKGWTHKNYVNGFVVRNNLMAYSTSMFMHSNFNNYKVVTDGLYTKDGVTVYGNTFIGEYGQNFGRFGYSISASGATDVTYSYDMDTKGKMLQYLPASYLIDNEYYFVVK